ncbi:MAG: sensor histidine kinase [Verrucomicrobia bacterium]|nr:sensor histidine kinase [Verrucomicrobiota bacterium]
MALRIPKFEERGIQRTLAVGFILVILLLGVAATVAVRHSRRIRSTVAQMTHDQLDIARLVHDVQAEETAMAQLLHPAMQRELSPETQAGLLDQLDDTRRQIAQLLQEEQNSPHRDLWRELDTQMGLFTQEAHRVFGGGGPYTRKVIRPLFEHHEKMLRLVDSIINASSRRLTAMEHDIERQSKNLGDRATWLLGLGLGLSVICALVTMGFVNRTLRIMRWQTDELNRVSRHMLHTQEEAARRFSHELHDELGQSLAALRSNLIPERHQYLEAVRGDCLALVDESIRNVRELSQLLRPVVLDDLGLHAGLRWLALKSAERLNIEVAYHSNTERRFPEEVETHLFRICQEAMTNIARHSGATKAAVRLHEGADRVVLLVEDDGRGLPTGALAVPDSAGLGMTSMRARARMLGGELEVSSLKPHGLRIRVEVPLGEALAAAASEDPKVPG